jgi:hypothetical protein
MRTRNGKQILWFLLPPSVWACGTVVLVEAVQPNLEHCNRPDSLAHILSNAWDWATLLQNILLVAASRLTASGGRRA